MEGQWLAYASPSVSDVNVVALSFAFFFAFAYVFYRHWLFKDYEVASSLVQVGDRLA